MLLLPLQYFNLKNGVSDHLYFYKFLTRENEKILPAKWSAYFLYNSAKRGMILFFSDELEFCTELSVKK